MESLFSPGQRPPSPSSSGPVTDFALIESQKENIRPLATGRSAATLSSVFKEPTAADKVVQEGHERLRKDIEDAEMRDKEGEDMIDGILDILDVYNKYILFVVQHHVSSDTHLLPLLETATRRFVNDTRYTQDIRYLKLWVMYSRQIERREEIWAFLESRDIGTRHSVFYEEWASALEGLGRRKKADEIYRLGIARKASPPDRLKNRHKQFLERIMAPPSGVVPDDESSSSTSAPARTLGRSILGQVATASTSVAGATQLAPSLRVASKGNGSKMEVFSDDNGRSEDTAPGEWADFGTRDARRKENTIEATPWKGETLPQSASRPRMTPRTPKVEVFKDVSENEGIRSADEVFVRQKQPPTEAELLKSDPLRHYDTSELSTAIPSLPAPPSARKPPRSGKPSSSSRFVMQPWECPKDGPDTKNAAGKVERRMFDWNAVYKNGDEWSFEEIRARQRGLLGKEWKGEVKEWERSWHNPGSSTPKAEEKKVKPPSPTVNTKLAELEVMKMFDQTIHGGKVRGSASDSDDSSDEEEEEEPVQGAPTPLPARPASIAMLAATPGAMIPPTPTPAGQSRLFTPDENPTSKPLVFNDENAASSKPTVFQDENIQSSKPAVFSDENSVPPSASKPGKFNIFNDTPAKTPLTNRTPLASSSSKPKAFGIFSDENGDQENAVQATPSAAPKQRQPLSQNLFATPALTRQGSYGRGVTKSIQEVPEGDGEAEEEEAGFVHEVQQGVARVDLNDVYEDEEEEERPRGMRRFQINTMTPITERTCEYTHMTNLRSSTASNTIPFSVAEDEEEGQEDAFVASDPAKVTAGISSTDSENQLPPQQAGNESISPPAQFIEFDKSILPEDDMPSGDINGKFQLPEGFTIHRNENTMHTMVLTDGETMHTAREGSVDPTTESENFVTANHQIPEILNIPNPCNPASPEILETILSSVETPIPQIPGFIDCRSTSSSNWTQLQKHAKSRGRRGSTNSRASVAPSDDILPIELQGKNYEFGDKIGEGGFGLVFSAVDVAQRQLEDDMDSDDEDGDGDGDEKKDKSILAIKVEQPCSIWEYIVLNRIYSRISQSALSSIIQTRQLYAFKDESYLLMNYSSQGTLLDVVNKANTIGISPSTSGGPSTLEEMLCIFFIVELLKLVEELHSNDFIHGDLKIDNCLIRLPDIPSSSWSASYSKEGKNGWSSKGVRLIDFGKTLDLTLYPSKRDQKFVIGDWKADEKDCIEMQNGENWSYQTDYYGLASIAYTMLYGRYIKVVKGQDGLWAIDQGLRRYWQQDLWTNFFRTFLNPGDDLPITDKLVGIRQGFENWLEENCQKGGKNLKSLLKKIELAAITGKR